MTPDSLDRFEKDDITGEIACVSRIMNVRVWAMRGWTATDKHLIDTYSVLTAERLAKARSVVGCDSARVSAHNRRKAWNAGKKRQSPCGPGLHNVGAKLNQETV